MFGDLDSKVTVVAQKPQFFQSSYSNNKLASNLPIQCLIVSCSDLLIKYMYVWLISGNLKYTVIRTESLSVVDITLNRLRGSVFVNYTFVSFLYSFLFLFYNKTY